MKNLSNFEAELKKALLIKRACKVYVLESRVKPLK